MKRKRKTEIRIDYAVKAVIEALERHEEKYPGTCLLKRKLIPRVSQRAELIMNEDNEYFWENSIGIPNDNFIKNHWSSICLEAAKSYKKYIVWDRTGVRLGTFNEYQIIPKKTLRNIGIGIIDYANDMTSIILKQGGKGIYQGVDIKQLESGEEKEKQLEL